MSQSKILIIGSGGREHALAWRFQQEGCWVVVSPGNDGMNFNRWNITPTKENFKTLVLMAKQHHIDLVVVGPDNPIADGVVDEFEKSNLMVFGPTQKASKLEWSKSFAKEVLSAAHVPTPEAEVFFDKTKALDWLKTHEKNFKPLAIKADGLAFGKGVILAHSLDEAFKAVETLFPISKQLLFEQIVEGEELSVFALCDGQRAVVLDASRDHKRLLNQNQGPNTGGMGAFSPVPGIEKPLLKQFENEIFLPVLLEMKRRGIPYRGVLYAGLMLSSAKKYWVLEFNARFGDPETQALLPRWEKAITPWFKACCLGGEGLKSLVQKVGEPSFSIDSVMAVVAAAPGYPDQPVLGGLIKGNMDEDEKNNNGFFFSGVKLDSTPALRVAGGRVLCAWAKAPTLSLARKEVYKKLSQISFDGMQMRTDL